VRGRLPGRVRTLAADRSFRIFMLATLVTGLGSYAGAIALALRTFDATRSPTWASLLFVAELVPGALLGAAGGRLLDRLPPRRTLAAAEAAGGVLWLLLALVGRPPVVLVLALAAGTAGATVRIVSAATLPRIAGDALEAANGAVVSAENTTMLVGTAHDGGSIAFVAMALAASVGVYILFTAWRIARGSLDLLMDRELPDSARHRIREIALANPVVRDLHDLRTRSSGQATFIQFHLELDGAMALTQAHAVSDEVEDAILMEFPGAEIIIHEDPAGVPERRRRFG